jgi:hypothetical protein
MNRAMNIRLDKCRSVKVDDNGKWEILRCLSNANEVYVIWMHEENIENVVEAFAKAKEEGFINELTTIYWMECKEWIGVVGMYETALNVVISDYSRVGCTIRLMEIVKRVIIKLSEVKR